jgi:hypothetical protein
MRRSLGPHTVYAVLHASDMAHPYYPWLSLVVGHRLKLREDTIGRDQLRI